MVPFRWFSACATIVLAVCLIISCENPTSSDDPVTPDDPSGGDPTTYTNTITVNGEEYDIASVSVVDNEIMGYTAIELSDQAPPDASIVGPVSANPVYSIEIRFSCDSSSQIPAGSYTSIDQCEIVYLNCGMDMYDSDDDSYSVTINVDISGNDGESVVFDGSVLFEPSGDTADIAVTVSYDGPYEYELIQALVQ